MDWFLFALIGAASLAVTGVVDKYILGNYVQNCNAYLITLILLQQIFALGIFLFAGPGFIYPQSFYAMAAGAAQVVLWAAYLRALQVEEASRVTALVYVYPIFVFPAAYIFLGEALTGRDYAGCILLVISALLVSYRPPARGDSLILSPALKYMLFFWIFSAIYAVAAKYLLSFMDEWHLILWSSLGNLVVILPFLMIRDIRAETFGYCQGGHLLFAGLIADEIFDFIGRGALIFAYAMGSVALVSSVAALQPFITLTYIIALGKFIPGALVEELGPKSLILKTIAVFLIIIGIYFIS